MPKQLRLVDNKSAIPLAKDYTKSRRLKHVSTRNHYCREQYKAGKIDINFIINKDQLTDSPTKLASYLVIKAAIIGGGFHLLKSLVCLLTCPIRTTPT